MTQEYIFMRHEDPGTSYQGGVHDIEIESVLDPAHEVHQLPVMGRLKRLAEKIRPLIKGKSIGFSCSTHSDDDPLKRTYNTALILARLLGQKGNIIGDWELSQDQTDSFSEIASRRSSDLEIMVSHRPNLQRELRIADGATIRFGDAYYVSSTGKITKLSDDRKERQQ